MKLLENLALFWLLALLPVQDTVLQQTPLRNLGASLSLFPLLVLLGLWLVKRLGSLEWRVNRVALLIAFYCMSLTVAYLIRWGSTFQGSGLVAKSFNLSVILALYLFGIFGVRYAPNRWLRAGAMAGFALTLLACLLGPALDGNGLLHSTINLDARPRGFATESSTFSVQSVISGLLALFFARGRMARLLIAAATVGLLVYSGSKGGLISLLLCVAIYSLARSGFSVLRLAVAAAILLPAGWFVVNLISQGFENDLISNGSSVATRATMTLFAGLSVLHNPLGVGFSGFYPAIGRYLPDAMASVNSFFQFPLVFTEVANYRYTVENADCKTLFLNMAVCFGVPFVLLFVVFFAGLLRKLYRSRQQILFIGVLFAATALITYYSSMNTYSIPVLLGICLASVRYENDPLRLRA